MSRLDKPKYAAGDHVAVCLYDSDVVRGTIMSVVPASMTHIENNVNAVVGEPLYLIRTKGKGPPIAYAVREIDGAKILPRTRAGLRSTMAAISYALRNAYYGRESRHYRDEL